MKKRAFTLVELMVVLAIIALLSALIFGAISSVREGNKRGSCQGNLNLIYAATRLYAQDNDGQFPYFNADVAKDTASSPDKTPNKGLGLWALYVYGPQPANSSPDPVYGLPYSPNDSLDPAKPATLSSYLKAPRAFHCPSDNFDHVVSYTGGSQPKTISSGELEFKGDDNRQHLNPYYLSYQGVDDQPNGGLYSSFRYSEATRQMRSFKQNDPTTDKVSLRDRRAPDQTVMTWCRFHRPLTKDGLTVSTTDLSRTFDNVLFLDGSVQSVPVQQLVTGISPTGTTTGTYLCKGWSRVPLAEANATPDAVLQQGVAAGFCTAQ